MGGDRADEALARRVVDAAQTALTALEVADMLDDPAERERMTATAERELGHIVELVRGKE